MNDGGYHRQPVLLRYLYHEPEVEYTDASFGSIVHEEEVAGMRIIVEVSDLKQLSEIALLAQIDHLGNLSIGCFRQVDAIDPF